MKTLPSTAALCADARLADLCPKESLSATQSFKRMKVKIKREIIALNRPQIRPEAGRAPAVTPERLRVWLDAGCDDEGRPVVLRATRNACERDLGSFADRVDLRLGKFSEFAPAIEECAVDFAGQTVVTFCTAASVAKKPRCSCRTAASSASISSKAASSKASSRLAPACGPATAPSLGPPRHRIAEIDNPYTSCAESKK